MESMETLEFRLRVPAKPDLDSATRLALLDEATLAKMPSDIAQGVLPRDDMEPADEVVAELVNRDRLGVVLDLFRVANVQRRPGQELRGTGNRQLPDPERRQLSLRAALSGRDRHP